MLLVVTAANGKELIRYEPASNKINAIPEPAKPARTPEETENNEQLFLTAQHLEQYRHATYSPVPYYEEALKRDPKDIRCNNALGVWYMRRGQFVKSESYFRKAIETSIQRNPNPYDTEPYYNLGLCLKFRDRPDEAYTYFYKATWSSAWKDSGYFSVAQIDMGRGDYAVALEHINEAIDFNGNNSKAYVIKAAAHRKLGEFDKAHLVSQAALKRDPFNLGALYELSLIYGAMGKPAECSSALDELIKLSRGYEQNLIAYALDYAAAALYVEASDLLGHAVKGTFTHPLVYYHMASFSYYSRNKEMTLKWLKKAASADSYLCFPNRLEEVNALQLAIDLNPEDSLAPYYLGNLFYDKRQYTDAIRNWEKSAKANSSFPTVWRNLGIAYFNKLNDQEKALICFEKAFQLDTSDDRVLMELHQLYKRLNRKPEERLKFLETFLETTLNRDDVYLERISIYNFMGNHAKAIQLLKERKFHPWEGGEGKASGQYVSALVQTAGMMIEEGHHHRAIELLSQAQVYPYNLGEGKLYGTQENDIFYLMGCAFDELGNHEQAVECFKKATIGASEPTAAIFYNDQQPDKIFYQGLAWKKLGEQERANQIFNRLIDYGREHMNDVVKIDYFAVSLPNLLVFEDDLELRNLIHCQFISGLGYLGLGSNDLARKLFLAVLSLDAEHAGAKQHLEMPKPIINFIA